MKLRYSIIFLTCLVFSVLTAAQGAVCQPLLTALYTAASEACIGAPLGYVCNGGSAPHAEPVGPMNSLAPLGALVEASAFDAIRTPLMSSSGVSGLVWIRVSDFVQFTGLLIGDVSIRDVSGPEFAAWQSLVVQTGTQDSDCADAPPSVLALQNNANQPTRVVVNGVSLDINGTVVVRTVSDATYFVAISGQMRALSLGQIEPAVAGQQIVVRHNLGDYTFPTSAPSAAQPFDSTAVRNLPVILFDRPVRLPQPGYVATEGAVNLRSAPSTNAAILLQVPAGQTMTVLGRNTSGDWLHVQLSTGQTGWMFSSLLSRSLGPVDMIYEQTPMPPQRLGTIALRAFINAPQGVNLRAAPDAGFVPIGALQFGQEVSLIARSPYSPWVKVNAGGLIGWLALLYLDTNAVIEALPVDYDVPPPPPPTAVPGSFGNAFPDPKGEGG